MPMFESAKTRRFGRRAIFFSTSCIPNCSFACVSLAIYGIQVVAFTRRTAPRRHGAISFQSNVCFQFSSPMDGLLDNSSHTPLDSVVSRWPSHVLAWTNAYRRLNSVVPDLLTHKLPTHQRICVSLLLLPLSCRQRGSLSKS